MWVDRESDILIGGVHLGWEEMFTEASSAPSGEGDRIVKSRQSRSPSRRPIIVGVHGRSYSAPLERSYMVDPSEWDEGRLPHVGHAPRYPPISVEGKEWARSEMECIVGAHQNPLWAEATVRTTRGIVER